MGHFDFARPSGIWTTEMVPGATDYYRWDVTQSKLLGGDGGDNRAPTGPIVIGGAGLFLLYGSITGGVKTVSGGRIQLGQYDIPALSPPRPFQTLFSLATRLPTAINPNGTIGAASSEFALSGGGGLSQFTYRPDDYFQGVTTQTASGLLIAGNASLFPLVAPLIGVNTCGWSIPSEYLNCGRTAQLASATLNFRVASAPAVVPAIGFSFGIFEQHQTGAAFVPSTNPPTGPQQLLRIDELPAWSSRTWATNSYVAPLNNRAAPLSYFRCVNPGTSAATEPNWNTNPGGVTFDGTVTWQCVGPSGQFFGTTSGALGLDNTSVDPHGYQDGAQPQSITVAFDTTLNQNLSGPDTSYAAVLFNPPQDGSIIYHSIQFTFVGITDLSTP